MHDVGPNSNRKQTGRVPGGGGCGGRHPAPLVRALGAADASAVDAAIVVSMLVAYDAQNGVAIAAARGIPPLIALLASPLVGARGTVSAALIRLRELAENRVTIASDGGIPPPIALVASTSSARRKLLPAGRRAGYPVPQPRKQCRDSVGWGHSSSHRAYRITISQLAGGRCGRTEQPEPHGCQEQGHNRSGRWHSSSHRAPGIAVVRRGGCCACAVGPLSATAENKVAIASAAGGIPLLIALRGSPSVELGGGCCGVDAALASTKWMLSLKCTC